MITERWNEAKRSSLASMVEQVIAPELINLLALPEAS